MNTESTARQYALRQRAVALGWGPGSARAALALRPQHIVTLRRDGRNLDDPSAEALAFAANDW